MFSKAPSSVEDRRQVILFFGYPDSVQGGDCWFHRPPTMTKSSFGRCLLGPHQKLAPHGPRQVHVPGNLVPSEDAYQSAISGQKILEDCAWSFESDMSGLCGIFHGIVGDAFTDLQQKCARKKLQGSCR